MPATSNYVESKARRASEALTKKRFVKLVDDDTDSVEMCDSDGESAYGVVLYSVSSTEIDQGKLASVQVMGRAVVEASAEIKAGELVATTTTGKAKVATSGDIVLGMCDEPASGDTKECSVQLSIGSAGAA